MFNERKSLLQRELGPTGVLHRAKARVAGVVADFEGELDLQCRHHPVFAGHVVRRSEPVSNRAVPEHEGARRSLEQEGDVGTAATDRSRAGDILAKDL